FLGDEQWMVDLLHVRHEWADLDGPQTLDVVAGDHVHDAWRGAGGGDIERRQPRVREGAAKDRDVQQVGQPNGFHILPRAGDEATVLEATQRLSNPIHGSKGTPHTPPAPPVGGCVGSYTKRPSVWPVRVMRSRKASSTGVGHHGMPKMMLAAAFSIGI